MPHPPLRVLIAKPGLDGHDRGAKIIARGLRDAGMEVIYNGLRQSPAMIAEAALNNEGLDELEAAIHAHQQHLETHGLLWAQYEAQLEAEFKQRLRDSLYCRFFDTMTESELAGIIGSISQQRIDPQQAVDQLLDKYEIIS